MTIQLGGLQSGLKISPISGQQPVDSLVFHIQPGNAVAGSSFGQQPVVWKLTDGILDTGFTGDITIGIATGTGPLLGTLIVPAVAGEAMFTNLQDDTAGDVVTLRASHAALSVDSDPFTVATAFDPDAQDYFDRIALAGGSISSDRKTSANSFILALKASATWSKYKEVFRSFTDGFTGSECKIKWPSGASSSVTLVNFVSGDYNSLTGFQGNGTDKWINPGTTYAQLGVSSAGQTFCYFSQNASWSNVKISIGDGGYFGYNGGGNSNGLDTPGEGFTAMVSNSTQATGYCKGASVGTGTLYPDGDAFKVMNHSDVLFDSGRLGGYMVASELTSGEISDISITWNSAYGDLVSISKTDIVAGVGDSISTDGFIPANENFITLFADDIGKTGDLCGHGGTQWTTEGSHNILEWFAIQFPTLNLSLYNINDVDGYIASGTPTPAQYEAALRLNIPFLMQTTNSSLIQVILCDSIAAAQVDDSPTHIAQHEEFVAKSTAVANDLGIYMCPLYVAMRDSGAIATLNPGLHPPAIGHLFMSYMVLGTYLGREVTQFLGFGNGASFVTLGAGLYIVISTNSDRICFWGKVSTETQPDASAQGATSYAMVSIGVLDSEADVAGEFATQINSQTGFVANNYTTANITVFDSASGTRVNAVTAGACSSVSIPVQGR